MMSAMVVLMCGILSLVSTGSAMALDLPADIMADQYLLEATEALEQGDPQRALRAFENIEALDSEPPMEFLFFYGKLLVEHGTTLEDVRKGEGLLKQFIINIEKDSEHYGPTLKLLSMAGVKIERLAAVLKSLKHHGTMAGVKIERLSAVLKSLKQQMVAVPGGTFTMGCAEKQSSCSDDELPARQVQVRSFTISKYEVTQDLWEAVMGENPSMFKGCGAQCPVDTVSWEDIQVFLDKLSELTGERYRLPTEAEWEYAARGGRQSRGYKYAGGNELHSVASVNKVYPVGQKKPNELGLYDMSGNVWEWVEDCWNKNYNGAPDDGSAWVNGACGKRVLRGGSWENIWPRTLRSAGRGRSDTGYRGYGLGFRVARTL